MVNNGFCYLIHENPNTSFINKQTGEVHGDTNISIYLHLCTLSMQCTMYGTYIHMPNAKCNTAICYMSGKQKHEMQQLKGTIRHWHIKKPKKYCEIPSETIIQMTQTS